MATISLKKAEGLNTGGRKLRFPDVAGFISDVRIALEGVFVADEPRLVARHRAKMSVKERSEMDAQMLGIL